MTNLKKEFEKMIDRKILETGKMGNEVVNVSLELTDLDKDIFLEYLANDFKSWEFDGNTLYIQYSEEEEKTSSQKWLEVVDEICTDKGYEDSPAYDLIYDECVKGRSEEDAKEMIQEMLKDFN